jgi:hypothetical protein
VFVLAAKDAFDQTVAEAHAEEVFLRLLRDYSVQNRSVSDKHSSSYAPAIFVKDPTVGKLTKHELELAMNRLFTANRIKVEKEGPPSRQTRKIVETATEAEPSEPPPEPPSDATSDDVQTPSDGFQTTWPHTPLIPPPPSEGSEGGLQTPPTPQTEGEREKSARATEAQDSLPSDAEVVGQAPPGERCFSCGKGDGVKLIRRRKGEPADQMHIGCAARAWAAEETP